MCVADEFECVMCKWRGFASECTTKPRTDIPVLSLLYCPSCGEPIQVEDMPIFILDDTLLQTKTN